MRILFPLLFILLNSICFSQNLNEIYKRIDKKIRFDEGYLDIHSVQFTPTESLLNDLRSIPLKNGNLFNFRIDENVIYKFLYSKSSPEIDTLIMLELREELTSTAASEGRLFGDISVQEGETKTEINAVIKFQDFNNLYFTDRNLYNKITNFVEKLSQETEPESKLTIPIDESFIMRGAVFSRDNSDFLNYQGINSSHSYPKTTTASAGGRRSRRESSAGGNMKIEGSFYKATFFHPEMNFDFTTLGAELSFEHDLLNLLPWQGMIMKGGVRSLTFLTGSQGPENSISFDIKVLARFKINTVNLATNLPFMVTEIPKLNVQPGVDLSLSTSRIYESPFINIDYSTGSSEINNPYYRFNTGPGRSHAYFTNSQWMTTISYYWQTNQEGTVRLRFDIGAGSYNVIRADYIGGASPNTSEVFNSINPLIGFHLNFIPKIKGKETELFHANLRMYDSVIRAKLWLKLLEFDSLHIVRFETYILSSPLYRGTREWENKSSTYLGFIYRYGF